MSARVRILVAFVAIVVVALACGGSGSPVGSCGAGMGGAGQACCPGRTCNSGETCVGNPGVCALCGGAGQACCDLGSCSGGGCCVGNAGGGGRTCTSAGSMCAINMQAC